MLNISTANDFTFTVFLHQSERRKLQLLLTGGPEEFQGGDSGSHANKGIMEVDIILMKRKELNYNDQIIKIITIRMLLIQSLSSLLALKHNHAWRYVEQGMTSLNSYNCTYLIDCLVTYLHEVVAVPGVRIVAHDLIGRHHFM